MSSKILFVDDEPAVLDGYQRMLRRDFEIDTALGGELGLASLQTRGPYAVVVSDMRMPNMDGVQFLGRVRQLAPDTVRMVLTGQADINNAIDAVNQGYLFRFLSKPCDKETMSKALTAALVQYRLITAEKELLENTLMGSIKVLTEILSLANPAAFGRSMRIRSHVQQIVKKLGLDAPWRFEAAAMLSQLGCITLDPETIEAAYCGRELSPSEQSKFDQHPTVAKDLLGNIPRLEPIAWMVAQQASRPVKSDGGDIPESIVTGATILQIAISYDGLRMRGLSKNEAIADLKAKNTFKSQLIDILRELDTASAPLEKKLVPLAQLRPGMILEEEIRTSAGLLFVGKGQEITHPILARLRNFQNAQALPSQVLALVPSSQA